ncbi:MAG: acyl-CoA thioesterase domain-containing protein, partial [Acidimicrobiia bacterium]
MGTQASGVYLPTDDDSVYESTNLANAGWYEEGQHGGALAALVAGHMERVPSLARMSISRMTLEIFRVVPLVPLRLETSIVREGKRIQVVEARVHDPDGRELARAHIQRLRLSNVGLPTAVSESPPPFPGPDSFALDQSVGWGHGPEG